MRNLNILGKCLFWESTWRTQAMSLRAAYFLNMFDMLMVLDMNVTAICDAPSGLDMYCPLMNAGPA